VNILAERLVALVAGVAFAPPLLVAQPAAAFAPVLSFAQPAAAPSPHPAEAVLLNGVVITVDAQDSIAQALAISGGKVVEVGPDASVKRYIGEGTRVIDLRGRTVTPGLIDSHFHMDGSSALEIDAGYPAVRSIADVVERVRERVKQKKPGEWVLGRSWDEGKLAERRYILASDLDPVSPENPVFISHTTGHYAVVNSLAMRLAGISRQSPEPPAGTIDRDSSGNPTGVLKEHATALVTKLIPPYSEQQQRDGFRAVLRELNAQGMTAIKDPGISQQKWNIYGEMLQAGELTARVFALWANKGTVEDAKALIERVGATSRPYEARFNDGRLIAGGVKLFLDGSGGARTAWMHEEWNRNLTGKDSGNFGYPLIQPDVYRTIVRLFHDAGMHVATHAIGDRAIDLVVDTYADVLRKHPVRGMRHAIIHANIPSDHAIDVMASLQRLYDSGYPESQAEFMWWIGDVYAGNFGEKRNLRLKPFKSYLDKGVHWAGGSDYDVTPLPAKDGLWASIARETLLGTYGAHPFGTAQSVDVHSALRSYTNWAAHQLFLDNRVGSLERGKEADLAVWDRNLYSVPTAQIKDMKCELTMLAGRIVYQAPGSALTSH
jgi:predicted amidohydrolase YtcJ